MSGAYYPWRGQSGTLHEALVVSGELLRVSVVRLGVVRPNVNVQPQRACSGAILRLAARAAERGGAEPVVSAQVNELNQPVSCLTPLVAHATALLGYEGMITSGENTFKKRLDIGLSDC